MTFDFVKKQIMKSKPIFKKNEPELLDKWINYLIKNKKDFDYNGNDFKSGVDDFELSLMKTYKNHNQLFFVDIWFKNDWAYTDWYKWDNAKQELINVNHIYSDYKD